MMRLKRVERILVALLLLGITASGSYFFFFDSSIRPIHTSENSLGYVRPMGADVRMRGESEQSWGHIGQDANVFKNDRVFTGSSSTAVVSLKSKQKLTVEPNSLVVISDHEDSLNLDLKSGGFFGEIKRGARLLIKKNKTLFELKAPSDDTTLQLESTNDNEIKLVVLKGEVAVQTQTEPNAPIQKVSANDEAIISNLNPAVVDVKSLSIHLISPGPGDTLWDKSEPIKFEWNASDKGKKVTLEISDDPFFKQNVNRMPVLNGMNAQMNLSPGRVYFWRVRSESDQSERSPTSSFSYYPLKGPEISSETLIEGPLNWRNETTQPSTLSWRDPSLSESYEVQISESKDFSKILYSEVTEKTELHVTSLKSGVLFWRVQSKHVSRERLSSNIGKLVIKSRENAETAPVPRSLASNEPDKNNTTTSAPLPLGEMGPPFENKAKIPSSLVAAEKKEKPVVQAIEKKAESAKKHLIFQASPKVNLGQEQEQEQEQDFSHQKNYHRSAVEDVSPLLGNVRSRSYFLFEFTNVLTRQDLRTNAGGYSELLSKSSPGVRLQWREEVSTTWDLNLTFAQHSINQTVPQGSVLDGDSSFTEFAVSGLWNLKQEPSEEISRWRLGPILKYRTEPITARLSGSTIRVESPQVVLIGAGLENERVIAPEKKNLRFKTGLSIWYSPRVSYSDYVISNGYGLSVDIRLLRPIQRQLNLSGGISYGLSRYESSLGDHVSQQVIFGLGLIYRFGDSEEDQVLSSPHKPKIENGGSK